MKQELNGSQIKVSIQNITQHQALENLKKGKMNAHFLPHSGSYKLSKNKSRPEVGDKIVKEEEK